MRINLDSASLTTARMLEGYNKAVKENQQKLATGKEVNSASDNATVYKASQALDSEVQSLQNINLNIQDAVNVLKAGTTVLDTAKTQLQQAKDIAIKAQSLGATLDRATQPTANISRTTLVAGSVANDVLSITSDSGQNFKFTFKNATTTWGEVIDALNASNIGVRADVVASATAGQTNLRFTATNGKDFTFDAISDDGLMVGLTGMTSPTGQIFNAANLFTTGTTAPLTTETGFTVGYGGQVTGVRTPALTTATLITAGSTLSLKDANGVTRTYTAGATATVQNLMDTVNGWLGAGLRAELVNQAGAGIMQLRIRNTQGGNVEILGGTGDLVTSTTAALATGIFVSNAGSSIASVGMASPLASNTTDRLAQGVLSDKIITLMNETLKFVAAPAGKNILNSEGGKITISGSGVTVDMPTTSMQGATNTNTPLGIAITGNLWGSDTSLQTFLSQVNTAIDTINNFTAKVSDTINNAQSVIDINQTAIDDKSGLSSDMVKSQDERLMAMMKAIETLQQLATAGFGITNSSNRTAVEMSRG